MRNLLFLFAALCSATVFAQTHTINFVDSYGDGWSGGFITVEGVDYSLDDYSADNQFGSTDITLTDPSCVLVTITAGSYENEMSFDIVDIATGDFVVVWNGNGWFGAMGDTQTAQSSACPVFGCTDVDATNYSVDATDDDGTCLFDQNYVDNNSGGGGDDCTEFEDSIVVLNTLLDAEITDNLVLNDSIVQLNVELTDCLENGADCSSQDMIIAELQGTISAYQADIDTLNDTVLALQLQITELQAINAANMITIDSLSYDVNFYLSTIEANEILIADLQQQLADCLEGDMTGIIDNGSTDTEKVLLFATNALGQRVAADTVGQVIILHYADGSSEKIIRDVR
tara:strand:- start:759 stop:1787 length:1029 start_codon:yes stop_codon:yes gene_type:complete